MEKKCQWARIAAVVGDTVFRYYDNVEISFAENMADYAGVDHPGNDQYL